MIISELPQPYKALAEKRQVEDIILNESRSNYLEDSFSWVSSEEGREFWSQCDDAESIDELPPFPYNINEDITTNKISDKDLIKHLQFEIKLKNEAISCLLLDDEKGFSGIEEAIEIYKKHFFPNE